MILLWSSISAMSNKPSRNHNSPFHHESSSTQGFVSHKDETISGRDEENNRGPTLPSNVCSA